VRGLERFGDLEGDRQRFVNGDRAPLDAIGEVCALHELHDEHVNLRRGGVYPRPIRIAGGRKARPYGILVDFEAFQSVQGRDIRVIQARQHLSLAFESGHPFRVRGELLRQHLERHIAVELGVAGQPHLPHPPLAELAENLVVEQRVTGQLQPTPSAVYFENHICAIIVAENGFSVSSPFLTIAAPRTKRSRK